MRLRSARPNTKASSAGKTADLSGAFAAPQEYVDGSRKRLKAFHCDDWWLNVDYLEAETPSILAA